MERDGRTHIFRFRTVRDTREPIQGEQLYPAHELHTTLMGASFQEVRQRADVLCTPAPDDAEGMYQLRSRQQNYDIVARIPMPHNPAVLAEIVDLIMKQSALTVLIYEAEVVG